MTVRPFSHVQRPDDPAVLLCHQGSGKRTIQFSNTKNRLDIAARTLILFPPNGYDVRLSEEGVTQHGGGFRKVTRLKFFYDNIVHNNLCIIIKIEN
jgi:hypothetical protein